MKKYFFFYTFAFLLTYSIFPILSLGEKLTDDLFSPQKKEQTDKLLRENKIHLESLKFKNRTLIDLDLSGMYLRGIDFSGCTLVNVNFSNADLTETEFNNTRIEDIAEIYSDINLEKAILYYPIDKNKKPLLDKSLKFINNDPLVLVKQYSELMNEKKEKEKIGSHEEAGILNKKAQSLNKIFGILKMDLSHKDLSNLNLSNLNFQNITLTGANLKGAWLSEKFQLKYENKTEIFESWDKANRENTPEKPLYQKLVNSGFDIFNHISNERLRLVNWKNLDLRNAYLYTIHFEDIDLSGSNLKGANLYGAQLNNANLSEVNLKGANLYGAQLNNANLSEVNLKDANLDLSNLENAQFSKDFRFPFPLRPPFHPLPPFSPMYTYLFEEWDRANRDNTPEKIFYNKLVNAGTSIFDGIPNERLRQVNWKGLNLRNANLKNAKLQGIALSDVNLKRANLYKTNLSHAIINNTNFKKANLKYINLEKAHLQKVNLNFCDLYRAELLESKLKSVTFLGSSLKFTNLINATLEDIDFRSTNMSRLILAHNLFIPNFFTNEKLIEIYKSCSNIKNKNLLETIIKSRGLSLDLYSHIHPEPIYSEAVHTILKQKEIFIR